MNYKNILKTVLLCGFIAFTSCSSDDNDNNGQEFNGDDYLYYISGKINGQPFLFGQRVDATVLDYSEPGFGNSVTTPCAFNPSNGGLNYAAGVYPSLDNEARPEIYFDFVRFYLCDPNFNNNPAGSFNASFPVRMYDLATSNNSISGTTGAVAMFYAPDATNNMTRYGSLNADQSGNSFEITSSTNTSNFAQRKQFIEGNFSFKLYNDLDSSDIVEITEGQFKMDVFFD